MASFFAFIQLEGEDFIWPVPEPIRITSYFHDPNYPFRHLMEHSGIDIKIPQGTPVRSVASGHIVRVHDGGAGYSYIFIMHSDSLATVYGHVSSILVEENEFVMQGKVIALSGGQPETNGAGSFSTGPHLHFEVRIRLGGVLIPVDPLPYLPKVTLVQPVSWGAIKSILTK